jgi:DNA-binding NtrC family response regulator
VGSTAPLQADVRVIAATNRDPARAVADGLLREDLYYRLNVFPIELPPLRERADDLPLLAQHFLREMGEREGISKRLSPAAAAQLAAQRWPGNVRELRNVLQRAWVMTPGDEIGAEWLPQQAIAPASRGKDVLQIGVGAPLADVERQVILATLEHFGHQRERTAAALGVSLKTLYNRLKQYGL